RRGERGARGLRAARAPADARRRRRGRRARSARARRRARPRGAGAAAARSAPGIRARRRQRGAARPREWQDFGVAITPAAPPGAAAGVVELLRAQPAEHAIDTPRAAVEHAVTGMIAEPRRGRIFVARDGERFVGIVYVSFVWTLEHGGHSAWLEELYVRP